MSSNDLNSEAESNKKKGIDSFLTVNDLRELDANQGELSTQQRLAIKNYDRYKISELNKQSSEEAFDKKYMQLQVLANLSPFEEFLKEEYFL